MFFLTFHVSRTSGTSCWACYRKLWHPSAVFTRTDTFENCSSVQPLGNGPRHWQEAHRELSGRLSLPQPNYDLYPPLGTIDSHSHKRTLSTCPVIYLFSFTKLKAGSQTEACKRKQSHSPSQLNNHLNGTTARLYTSSTMYRLRLQ